MFVYYLLCAVFGVTAAASVYGMVRYGFNLIFLYILLFSVLVALWCVIAINDEKKAKDEQDKQQGG